MALTQDMRNIFDVHVAWARACRLLGLKACVYKGVPWVEGQETDRGDGGTGTRTQNLTQVPLEERTVVPIPSPQLPLQ